jgi:uncharacterized delta-60 repeat protein
MFGGIFVRLATAAALTGLASVGLLGAAPSGFAAGGAGSLDPTFGRGGEVVTSLGTNRVATDAILQPNGDIVVSVGIGAVRYLPNGSLDSTFGSGGFALAQPGFLGGALTLQSDGKIVVVGNTELAGGGENFVVARFNPNGSPDSTFTNPPFDYGTQEAGRDGAAAVTIQSNGQIVAVGGHFFGTEPSGVARLNTNGSLDAGFGNGGTVTTAFPGGFGYAAVVIQTDGKIVAVGGASDPTTGLTNLTLARYLAQ